MPRPLQRILTERDGRFIFVTLGQKFIARTDHGITRGEFEVLCRSFEQTRERKNVRPGWKLGIADEWRRRSVLRKTKDGECVTHLHFLRPSGDLIVLEFFYAPLPMSVVDELKAFIDSLTAAQGEDHGRRQPHGQPVREAQRDPAAEGGGGVDLEVGEGLQGAREGGELAPVDVDPGSEEADADLGLTDDLSLEP